MPVAEPGRASFPTSAVPADRPPGSAAPVRPGLGVGGLRPATRARHRHPSHPPSGARAWRRMAILVLVALLVLGGVVLAANRLAAPPPAAVVTPAAMASFTVPGAPPPLPWAATGQSALAIPAIGYTQQSGAETPVPVASLTKIMTAYIVLRDHPLPALAASVPLAGPDPAGTDGPAVTISDSDQGYFDQASTTDQSNAPVQAGEQLTERQLLEGMLVHSANNLADTLAVWDAGSIPAFVAKMNATAARLGMGATHFVDASGFDPQSVSTAADILKVASMAMTEPAFARSVTMSQVTLPVAGTLDTYTPLIGVDGVVGVKSGFTSQAGGCVVTALRRTVQGRPMVILAAVLGQEAYDALAAAGLSALHLADAAAGAVVQAPALVPGMPVATAAAAGHTVTVRTTGGLHLLGWPGQVVARAVVVTAHPRAGAPAGTPVAVVRVALGRQAGQVAAVTAARLPPPTVLQRLL